LFIFPPFFENPAFGSNILETAKWLKIRKSAAQTIKQKEEILNFFSKAQTTLQTNKLIICLNKTVSSIKNLI